MAAGFVLLPPLLAFGLYFCAGHAVRHVLRVGAWCDASNPSKAAWFLVRVMAPAGVFCAAGLGLLAWMGSATIVDLLAPCFRIIAALTLPHMIVTAWLDRGGGATQKRPGWLKAHGTEGSSSGGMGAGRVPRSPPDAPTRLSPNAG
jgi:hypothetical protein